MYTIWCTQYIHRLRGGHEQFPSLLAIRPVKAKALSSAVGNAFPRYVVESMSAWAQFPPLNHNTLPNIRSSIALRSLQLESRCYDKIGAKLITKYQNIHGLSSLLHIASSFCCRRLHVRSESPKTYIPRPLHSAHTFPCTAYTTTLSRLGAQHNVVVD